MIKIHNLIDKFNREMEILEVDDDGIIYVIDQKSDKGNLCAIEHYAFETGDRKTLLSLNGTRLYESFGTYRAMKDYFYAVIIGSDYKLRLEEIDKRSWRIRQTYYIVPEGEVLNLYPVNEEYMIVTDEVMATDDILMKFQDEDYEGKYYNLTYLYHLKTGEKWFFQNVLDGLEVADVQTIPSTDGHYRLIFQLQQGNALGSRREELWMISDDELITALSHHQKLPFVKIETSADFHSLTHIQLAGDAYLYRLHDDMQNRDTICCVKETDGRWGRDCLAVIDLPKDGEVVYGVEDEDIYHVMTDEKGRMCVKSLKDRRCFTYDSAYGDFMGIYSDDVAVTSFYHSEMQKGDMVFKECAAIHHVNDGSVEIFDGSCEKRGSHLILLRSFLCL